MTQKGERKFKCDDCGETRYVHWVELNRRSRPRCHGCGSQQLEPYSKEAKEDQLHGNLNVAEFDEDRGDIIKS